MHLQKILILNQNHNVAADKNTRIREKGKIYYLITIRF